jgi:putative transposase
MARLARIVVPGLPHHVTQRGNRRQSLFVQKGDYALYRDLMAERCAANDVACWAYCFMPNHVHLILTPTREDGLARAVGEAHRRYTAFFNARARVTGHLFQGRFSSAAMDETHLLAALRYLALNPVRAGLVQRAEDWRPCSVAAHLAGRDDALVDVAPVLARVTNFRDLLDLDAGAADEADIFMPSESIGRPLGDEAFLAAVERQLGYSVRPGRRGRKPAGGALGD